MSELYENLDDDKNINLPETTIQQISTNISKQEAKKISTSVILVNKEEEDEEETQEDEDEEDEDEEDQEKDEEDEEDEEEQEDEEEDEEEQEDEEDEEEEEEEQQDENTDTNQNKGFVYLISIDDDPITYTYNRADAEKIMWKYAKDLYQDYMPTHKVFYITQKTLNSISIVGSYKFSIISYESTYNVIKYTKVYKN